MRIYKVTREVGQVQLKNRHVLDANGATEFHRFDRSAGATTYVVEGGGYQVRILLT